MSAPTDVGALSPPLPLSSVRIESSEDVVVLDAPENVHARLRPSIVLTTTLADGPLHVVSSNAIASILAMQRRAQVFAVEPDDHEDVLGVP